MIVRDESAVLQRCIDSLQGIYDELCIIDTGSEDNTIEIAQANEAYVKVFTGCNDATGKIVDFAKARDQALALASGDWVLQIDADEILLTGHNRIRDLIKKDELDQIGVLMESDSVTWVSVRVFRNIDGLIYRSKVHEYLPHPGNFFAERLIHIENRPNKKGKESSTSRNIRLCKLALDETPNDGRIYHYLGNEYRNLNLYLEAIEAYSKALSCGNYKIGLYHTSYYLGISYLIIDDWENALEAAFQCLRIDPRYAEAPCLLGDIYSSMGEVYRAIEWYKMALSKEGPPEDAIMAIQSWAYFEHPMERLKKLQVVSKRDCN